ncbi:MAG: glutamate synthase central domain-containing protein, partial [Pseudomonadota bacterium]
NGFYVCSLSCRSLIYKGMMLAEQVSEFYPDLQDERFESAFAIYHQRYSTNTFPQWWLAQPFRMLAHNGEINTLKGNLNWMKSHEIRLASTYFGEMAEDIKPIVATGSSDSAALDAVFELLVRAGRSAPMAKTMMVPEAWSKTATKMPEAWRQMYAYSNSVMEPWDGPAALAMTDGRWVAAGLDRNGLRPLRYVVTGDGLVIAGSEVGMVPADEGAVVEKGALGPGQMLAVDMARGVLLHDADLKDQLAGAQPFGEWVGSIRELETVTDGMTEAPVFEGPELRRRQIAAGYTLEELETILAPMVEDGKEVVGSMGDDTPAAVLSEKYRPLHHFFRQNFSQVTNPPIDPLREHRVMSLKTRFGNLKNVLDEDNSQTEILTLESPVVSNARFDAMLAYFGEAAREIDCTFDIAGGPRALRTALERVREEAEDAVRAGANHLILTETGQSESKAAMPMILATSAIHAWLTAKGLRTFTSLNVRSAEAMDPHTFAVLIGCGATTVNAYLAEDSIADRIGRGLLDMSLTEAMDRFRMAIDQGLLKIMSKMGISVISSYRGGLNFEAVGLSRAMVAEFFPGMPSRISGIGVAGIQKGVLASHRRAWQGAADVLPVGGFYKARRSGEVHAWGAQLMHMMQEACNRGSYELWKKYSDGMRAQPPIHLRDLLDFAPGREPVPIEEVESITAIRKRFVTPGMSLGALSPEAHKTLNIAMNRIGAKSDSGEGGEDPAHFQPEPNGDNPSAKI